MSLVISPHFSPEEQEGFKEPTSLNRLSITGLSRIIEVPLSLLETEQQPNEHNEYTEQEQEQQQQPRYWMPNYNTTSILVSEFEGGNVTHSFANRKRSIVKRRKSVLSRSFTPESEAEAIRIERETALAALENRLKKEETESETDEIYTKSLRRSLSISLPTSTEFGFSDIQNSPILILGRGPVLRRGAKSKFQRRSSCGTPSEIANYLSNTVESQELPPSPTATTATSSSSSTSSSTSSASSLSSSPNSPPTFTIQVVDYTTNNNENLLSTMNHPTDQDFKTLEAATAVATADPIFPIETNVKKSKLPWSKKLFSKTKKQKSSSVMIINDNNEKTTDDMMDEVRHNKFNLSSLFFKKQNLNALKKNKSAVNLSTPPSSTSKEVSPFTSSDTLVSTHYNNNATDTNNKNQTKTAVTSNFNNNRLPIHKERAIYKLSHLKLAHPRRPLRDQVMISNLMFWYLSIINQSNNNNNNNDSSNLSCENTLLPRKAYGIPVAGTNRRGTRRKTKTSQVLPEKGSKVTIPARMNSKAIQQQQQQRLKNANQRAKYRSLGSDDSDSESDEDEMSSSDEDDDDDDTNDFNGAEKMHKTNNKYRNHANIPNNNNNNNNKHHNNNTRLQHHHQQHHPQKRQYQKTFKKSRLNTSNNDDKEEEEEDDIPLAMYKPKHVS